MLLVVLFVIYYIYVPLCRIDEVFEKVIADKILVIRAVHTVVLAWEHHHLKALVMLYQCIRHSQSVGKRHIAIDIAAYQQQFAFEITSQLHIGRYWFQSMLCLTPPLYIDVVVMIARRCYAHLVEIGVSEHRSHCLKATS